MSEKPFTYKWVVDRWRDMPYRLRVTRETECFLVVLNKRRYAGEDRGWYEAKQAKNGFLGIFDSFAEAKECFLAEREHALASLEKRVAALRDELDDRRNITEDQCITDS